MIGSHSWARNPSFKTALAATPTGWSRVFIRCHPGERVVPPFSANAAWSVEESPIDHQATAASCSQNNPKHGVGVFCCPIAGFGQGEAVGVIGKPHRSGKCNF